MTVDRNRVPRGESVHFTMILTNIGQNDITIVFSSGQAFDLSYYTSTGWHRWSDGKAFVLWVWDVKLKPGENFSQTLEWNLYQYDRISGKFIPPEYGTYDVWGTCVGMPGAITPFPTAITVCVPGDITGPENPMGSGKYPPDGNVNTYDLAYLGKKFGTTDPVADFTGPENPTGSGNYPPDGTVNTYDLAMLGRNFGKTYP